MGIQWNEVSKNSNGGTELLGRELERRIDPALMENFQIVISRETGDLDPSKIRILWCHDTADDPMYASLANEGWRRYHRIVFVSHHQQTTFQLRYGIPASRCMVLLNAINPLEFAQRPADGKVKIVYTPTPHRGLNILHAAFTALSQQYDFLELDVFSSFELYGWAERDQHFRELFDALEGAPNVRNHGTKPNAEVRAALQGADIFAYPSIWQETSCLCLMEAMSAGLFCVHSDLGALYETAANWTVMYPYNEDLKAHANTFVSALDIAIRAVRDGRKLQSQAEYANHYYSWDLRAGQWTGWLTSILDLPRDMELNKGPVFSYTA